jgi:hypothetical protein
MESEYLEDLAVDGRIILKWILRKCGGKEALARLIWLIICTML